jgi:hypothetical protein
VPTEDPISQRGDAGGNLLSTSRIFGRYRHCLRHELRGASALRLAEHVASSSRATVRFHDGTEPVRYERRAEHSVSDDGCVITGSEDNRGNYGQAQYLYMSGQYYVTVPSSCASGQVGCSHSRKGRLD